MDKVISWLFLVIALMWLLPLIGVDQLGSVGSWISVVALVIIGVKGLMK